MTDKVDYTKSERFSRDIRHRSRALSRTEPNKTDCRLDNAFCEYPVCEMTARSQSFAKIVGIQDTARSIHSARRASGVTDQTRVRTAQTKKPGTNPGQMRTNRPHPRPPPNHPIKRQPPASPDAWRSRADRCKRLRCSQAPARSPAVRHGKDRALSRSHAPSQSASTTAVCDADA